LDFYSQGQKIILIYVAVHNIATTIALSEIYGKKSMLIQLR